MPESVPMLSPDTLRGWKGLSYTKLVVEVASLFIPTQQIPRKDLEGELMKYELCYHNMSFDVKACEVCNCRKK